MLKKKCLFFGTPCRLPKYKVEGYSTFTEESESFIVFLNTLKHTSFICGDFNLNLLLVNNNQHID